MILHQHDSLTGFLGLVGSLLVEIRSSRERCRLFSRYLKINGFLERELTFLGKLQLLQLSSTIGLHHQAMVLLDELPFLGIVSRGFTGNNDMGTMLIGLFVS